MRFGPQTYVPDVVKRGKTKKTKREREKGNITYITVCLAGQVIMSYCQVYIYIYVKFYQNLISTGPRDGKLGWVSPRDFAVELFKGRNAFIQNC